MTILKEANDPKGQLILTYPLFFLIFVLGAFTGAWIAIDARDTWERHHPQPTHCDWVYTPDSAYYGTAEGYMCELPDVILGMKGTK